MARIVQQGGTDSAEAVARAELRPGEHLIWWGRPRGSALLRQGGAASLIGIPFTMFAVFWFVSAYSTAQKAGDPAGWILPLSSWSSESDSSF